MKVVMKERKWGKPSYFSCVVEKTRFWLTHCIWAQQICVKRKRKMDEAFLLDVVHKALLLEMNQMSYIYVYEYILSFISPAMIVLSWLMKNRYDFCLLLIFQEISFHLQIPSTTLLWLSLFYVNTIFIIQNQNQVFLCVF